MKTSKRPVSVGIAVTAVTIGVTVLSAAAVMVLYFLTGYLPLLLAGIVIFMPAVINLLLFISAPADNVQNTSVTPSETVAEPEYKKPFIKRILHALWRFICKIGRGLRAVFRFIKKKRTVIVACVIALTIAALNYLYWVSVSFNNTHTLKVYVPFVTAVLFIAFIVLEKWAKHAETDGLYKVIVGNIKGVLTVGKFIWLLIAVATTLILLGLIDLTKITVVLVTVYFVYFTVMTVIALAGRLIKQEFGTHPDIAVPLPGQKGEKFDIIGYLEQNTGITMRSLWSMQIIKKTVPYAVMATALVLWLSTGIVQIESNQKGALYRVGKLNDKALEPGIHLTLPWPIDKVEIYDTETVKEVTIGYSAQDVSSNLWTEAHGENEYKLLLGGGNELVSMNLRVHYKIGDVISYLQNSAAPVSLLESAAYEIVTARTIVSDLDSMLAADREAFSESFKSELAERVKEYDIGVEVVSVIVESIHPPVDIADIYQQIISAGIQAEKLRLDAEAKAGVTVTTAEKEYYSAVNGAEADSLKSIADAKASVSEFMASLEADKSYSDAYRYYKYLNAIKSAYKDAKLVIVGEDVDSSNIYLGKIN